MMSVEGKVDVRCRIEDAWDLFCNFGDVARLIPTVSDVEVDGDKVHARVETKLGVLPISSRIYLEVTERTPPTCLNAPACLKARGLSYLGETITEQMKKDIEGIDADSAGRMKLQLDLQPTDEPGCITIMYAAEVEAEGRLKRIYEAILRTKVPKLMEEFAENIRGALESGAKPAEAAESISDAPVAPQDVSDAPVTAAAEPLAAQARAATPAPAAEGSRALALPKPEGLWARFMSWVRSFFRRLRGETT